MERKAYSCVGQGVRVSYGENHPARITELEKIREIMEGERFDASGDNGNYYNLSREARRRTDKDYYE